MQMVERVTDGKQHYFFGYFDITPESNDGKKVLVNRCSFIDRMPEVNDVLEVGYVDLSTLDFYKIGETTAWNFQEGCRLQWLNKSEIVYNIRTEHGFGARRYNLESKIIINEYDSPFYTVNNKLNIALSYDFVHNKYSYMVDELNSVEKEKEGIFLIDLAMGSKKLIITLARLEASEEINAEKSWVEYCVFNPSGDKFFFYYRWEDSNQVIWTRFYVSDLEGNFTLIHHTGMFSHAGWKSDTEITAWARSESVLSKLRKNGVLKKSGLFEYVVFIYHKFIKTNNLRNKITNDSYILINIEDQTIKKYETNIFESDGHCTWSKDSRFMLTDTYAGRNDCRKLMIYDDKESKLYMLGEFFAIPIGQDKAWYNSGMRCDLHPKWGSNDKYVYFDSVHEGLRQLYRICVRDIIEND